jgi:hypothetical protein
MPTGWFLVPYRRRPGGRVVRYCAMDDHTPAIRVAGGEWAETEVLGQHAVVKVSGTTEILGELAAAPDVQRIPVARLDDPLSSLTNAQRTAIRNRVLALGYTAEELDAALPGNLGNFTLRQLLLFICRRRRKVRYDAVTDTVVDDGPEQPVRPLDDVDSAVR